VEKFQILDVAGDAGIRAFGESLPDLFVHAALGMYRLMTNTDLLNEQKSMTVAIESHSLDGLLVAFLNELIFHFDVSGFIAKNIDIVDFSDNHIEARLSGQEFNPEQHERGLLIKAATYHRLSIKKEHHIWEAEIVFDI
jgi:SHS2 domain-containing protein